MCLHVPAWFFKAQIETSPFLTLKQKNMKQYLLFAMFALFTFGASAQEGPKADKKEKKMAKKEHKMAKKEYHGSERKANKKGEKAVKKDDKGDMKEEMHK